MNVFKSLRVILQFTHKSNTAEGKEQKGQEVMQEQGPTYGTG